MKFNKYARVGLDIILVGLSFFLAFYIRFDGDIPDKYVDLFWRSIGGILIIKTIVLYMLIPYTNLWKYAGSGEFFRLFTSTVTANIIYAAWLIVLNVGMPKSIFVLNCLIDVFLIGGSRFFYKMKGYKLRAQTNFQKNIMIIGAGDAGALVINELRNHRQLSSNPVAVIDDDPAKQGLKINGVPVMGRRKDIQKVVEKMGVDEIIISIPSATHMQLKETIEHCKNTKCKLKTLPGMFELINGKVSINKIRDVRIEDLLGREEVVLNVKEISEYLKDKKILVTGGGGSIGSELCRKLALFHPEKLYVLDIYENSVYDLANELKRDFNNLDLQIIIASISDEKRVQEVVKRVKPDVIFHTAAHKHVPLMEQNPSEAVKNNVFGTINVVRAAHENGVEKFVMISTDKAVNPKCIMGATKRICEMIACSMDKISHTKFTSVRFGNVLASSGSVIPLFQRQIADGGPVTVTHADATRYFMTISEAAQLIIEAGALAEGGEIFVLDMGNPIRILALAEDLIRLSGFEPYTQIPIEFIGLRPGEKLIEELYSEGEELVSTSHEKIFVCRPEVADFEWLAEELNALERVMENDCNKELTQYVSKLVPTYRPVHYGDSI
jgi:FlaA1/EpsC-like NDP-sugar epimerase